MPFETTLLAHPAWHLDHEADPPRISVISLANRERITTSLALPQCQPGTVRALRRPLAFSDDDLHLARALHALALRATPPVAFDPLSILAAARFTSPLDLTDLGCLVVHERTARVLQGLHSCAGPGRHRTALAARPNVGRRPASSRRPPCRCILGRVLVWRTAGWRSAQGAGVDRGHLSGSVIDHPLRLGGTGITKRQGTAPQKAKVGRIRSRQRLHWHGHFRPPRRNGRPQTAWHDAPSTRHR
jgi:hypothetical protein